MNPCDPGIHTPNCGGNFAALAPEVWERATTGDKEQLAALIAEHPAEVVYNSSRQALQMVTCEGRIALHIPLSDSQVAGL